MAAIPNIIDTGAGEPIQDMYDKLNAAIDALNILSATNTIGIEVEDIGDWDMFSTADVSIAHGKSIGSILFAFAMIINDNATEALDLCTARTNDSDYFPSGYIRITGANIVLNRLAGRYFSTTSFDSTGYNRGKLIYVYLK